MRNRSFSGYLLRSAALGVVMASLGGPLYAQQAPPSPTTSPAPPDQIPPKPEEVKKAGEVVVVTGSRIKNDTFSSASPMSVVTAEEGKLSGVTDLASLLQQSTAAAGSSQVTAAISNALAAPPGGFGTQTIQLRGLGESRTLTLLNGRRAGPAGTGGSVGPFDLNVIPLSAVERVEILKDGASSLYGSDAVAGVVNIITKKDSSSSLDFNYTRPEAGKAGSELQISGTWGQKFDNGYFRISADYYKQEEFDRGDRSYFGCSQPYFFKPDGSRADLVNPLTGDYNCSADVIWGHNWTYSYGDDTPVDAQGYKHRPWQASIGRYQFDYSGKLGQYLKAFNTTNNRAPSGLVNPNGWFPVGYSNILVPSAATGGADPVWSPTARNSAAVDSFYHPFEGRTTLSPELERISVVGSGEYDINDHLTTYGEVLLNRRSVHQDGVNQAYTFQHLYSYGDGTVSGDPVAIANGWTLDALHYEYVYLSPTAISDHADQGVQVDYMRFVAGLKGDLDFTGLSNWTFDLYGQFSRSDGTYKEDKFAVDAITDREQQESLCAGTLTRYRKVPCVDINWYSPRFLNGDWTAAEKAFLDITTHSRTAYEQTSAEVYATGPLFKLPAGDVSMVLGALYQDDRIDDIPDQAWLDGEVWDGAPQKRGRTKGDDDTRAIYTELSVPIVKDLPGLYNVNLSLSGRYTDVASYGGQGTYKAGLSWAITPSFRLRGSTGTSFRTPGLFELYLSNRLSGFALRGDPCAQWGPKLAAGQITQRTADNCRNDPKFPGGIGPTQLSTGGINATVSTSGGAGILKAEESDAKSLGAIWTPSFANLQVSVDYFDIQVNGEVSLPPVSSILTGCYNSLNFPNDPLCSLFSRKQPGQTPPGTLDQIRQSYINIAAQTSRGLDFEVHYGQEIPWGNLDFTLRASRQLESGRQLLPTSEFIDSVGTAGSPNWVGNLNSQFTSGPWTVFWGLRYVDATSNWAFFQRTNPIPATGYKFLGDPVTYQLSTPPKFYNLSASYDFGNLGLTARFGIRNVFNELPPKVSNIAGSGFITEGNSEIESQYDLFGRTYFVNLSKKF
jgi:iron complex outermembrane receptor protein